MLTFIHRYFTWLLSDEIDRLVTDTQTFSFALDSAKERETRLLAEIDTLLKISIQQDERRITLDELVLKPNQVSLMKTTTAEYRQALFDAAKMVWLTEVDEVARNAVIGYVKYLMQLTLHPTEANQIPSDRTEVDAINERKAKFFTPRV